MIYQYYLNGALLTQEPLGWQEMTSKIERVDEVKGLFVTVDLTLTFYGDAFDTLIASYGAGFCNDHTIRIDESCDEGRSYTTIYDGIIFISDCTFDYNNCTVEAKVQDNSFYAKINNNKSIKTIVEVGYTKNGTSYTGAADYQVEIFDPCTAAYYVGRKPHTVRVYEAFRSLIAFMTDDTVDFQSTFFDVGGDGEGYCITDGIHLSNTDPAVYSATRNIEKICFIDLFNEMNKRFNIGMMIDSSGARPLLIIEQYDYFKNATSALYMTKIKGLKASVDVDALYSQIHFGGTTVTGTGCPAGLAYPNDQTFLSFQDQTFYILSTCNIDKTLDLYCQWISDNNIIQDCVVNGSEDYDTDIFILETDYLTQVCVAGDPFGLTAATPRFYNVTLLNSAIAPRFAGAIPNTIAQQLNNINDECFVYRSSTTSFTALTNPPGPPGSYTPVAFSDDTTPPYFDTGGNFTLGVNSRYTASNGGLYIFNYTMNWRYRINSTVGYSASSLVVVIRFNHFDNTTAFLNSTEKQVTIGLPFTLIPVIPNPIILADLFSCDSGMFSMAIGDYIEVEVEAYTVSTDGITATIYVDTGTFKTVYTSNGGGIVQTYDPEDYPAFKYEFEYPLTKDDFQLLLNQPNYAVTLDVDGTNTFKAFIKEAKYKRKTGMAQFTCIASKSIDE